MLRPVRLPAVLLAASLALAGCGSDDSGESADSTPTPSPTESATPTPSASPTTAAATPTPTKAPQQGTTVDITIKGGKAKPDGVRKKAKAGEPIRLHIVSDTDGELHVHSSPEKEIAYQAGTTTRTITIDRPGVVDIEDHELHKLLVQLEVR